MVVHIRREIVAKRRPDETNPIGGRRSSGLVVTILGVLFIGFMASQWHERQHVMDIEVIGATGLSRLAVLHSVDTLKSKSLQSLTLADVRTCVEQIPYVRNAVVYFSGVRTLTVEIDERLPVAHVALKDGSLRYVDAQGVILPNAVERTAHNVPLLQSRDGSMLCAKDIENIVQLLLAGSRTLDPVLYQAISEVLYDTDSRSVEVVTDDTRWRLGVMNAERATLAFADMNVFWYETSQRMSMARVSLVDLRWRNQVVLQYRTTNSLLGRAA